MNPFFKVTFEQFEGDRSLLVVDATGKLTGQTVANPFGTMKNVFVLTTDLVNWTGKATSNTEITLTGPDTEQYPGNILLLKADN